MRDIRGELQERANLFEEQIDAHEVQFAKLIDQLKREHDQRREDLKTELEVVNRLLDLELRRFSSAPAAPTVQTPEAVHQGGASTGATVCPSTAAAFSASAGAG